jgi:hypothetical protein
VSARLAAGIEVSGLIRRIEGLGGSAAVLARGDAEAGAILLALADRGAFHGFLERALDAGGRYGWRRAGPQNVEDSQEISHYISRRRAIDGDLWVLELDIAGVERFAAEMIATG